MDSNRNRRLKPVPASAPKPPTVNADALMEAVNTQVMPQLAHLAHGPLAEGAFAALRHTIEQGQSITCGVLQVRVSFEGKLYTLNVHMVASAP